MNDATRDVAPLSLDRDAPFFLPACDVLLDGLGVSLSDFEASGSVLVNANYLRFLISRIAATAPVDPDWYAAHYPDIHAALIAGEIESCQDHFENHGYFEGRLFTEPAFDAHWYCRAYDDLRDHLGDDPSRARRHFFEETGHREGRAGIAAHLPAAEMWRNGRLR